MEGDIDNQNPSRHIYSRYTQGVSGRVEKVLSAVNVSIEYAVYRD
jgi:cystathionine gamma-synthase